MASRERHVEELHTRTQARAVDPFIVLSPPRDDMRKLYAIAALELPLSRKPVSFGRTVLEALMIGCPVFGWSHCGGELLQTLYPHGAVRLGGQASQHTAALGLLTQPAELPDEIPYLLAAMQDATLALYAHIAG